MTQTLSCDLHDYLEIACLYQYTVRLHLKDNQRLEGKALDILTENSREYLVLETDQRHRIDLMQLSKLQVLSPNAKFGEIRF
jgi:Rho-binding antiterminator